MICIFSDRSSVNVFRTVSMKEHDNCKCKINDLMRTVVGRIVAL